MVSTAVLWSKVIPLSQTKLGLEHQEWVAQAITADWAQALAELLPLSEPLLPPPTRVSRQPRLILPGHGHRLFRGTPAAGVLLTPTGPAVTAPLGRSIASRVEEPGPLCVEAIS